MLPSPRWLLALGLPVLAVLALVGISRFLLQRHAEAASLQAASQEEAPPQAPPGRERPTVPAPELTGGVGWLNTAGPIRLRDLRGKIVLLDFWTLCCINCIHTLPDLAKLEKKYPNQLVIIGVHTAKFENEKSNESIRKAILRYEISHPVVNDANQKIWRAYSVSSWPTLWLIDPEGNLVSYGQGENLYPAVDAAIERLIKIHRAKKTLDEEPLHFDLARLRERGDRPLFFPGKVVADASSARLFIADSTHHRIVITDLNGKKIAIAGMGESGRADGSFAQATFNDPQGMALDGETLYVADRKNHLIRALDLKQQTVRTIAGTGRQGENRWRGGPALATSLNSPWDLYLHGKRLFIAMAGHHQIWTLDLDQGLVNPYAGNGRENIVDGPLDEASFAQPSGLASDGTTLFVADSEVSGIRAVPMNGKGNVKTLIGEGLFDNGDEDGVGNQVRLQHPLGVAWHDGKLYIADTYNSKIKVLDPLLTSCKSFLGGKTSGWLTEPLFGEPCGLSFAGDKLYVADTNNHRIRVVDLKTKAVSTLALQGVEAPAAVGEAPTTERPPDQWQTMPPATVANRGTLKLEAELPLDAGYKLDTESSVSYGATTYPATKASWTETKSLALATPNLSITIPAEKLEGAKGVKLSVVYYECLEASRGLGRAKSYAWDVPLKLDPAAAEHVVHLSANAVVKNGGKRE
jgi:thiol-disulfide isomerase/thioredoxin/sugar lactone lactonase YvrE